MSRYTVSLSTSLFRSNRGTILVVMSFSIDTSGDIAGVVTLPKQLLFAVTQTLNSTAEDSQANVILLLKHGLHVRGNWIQPKTRFGINVTYAKKGGLESEVYTRADWLLEEEGYNDGIKHAESGTNLADPDVENTRFGIDNKVRADQKARRLLDNAAGSGFSGKTGKAIGVTGAFKVKGKYGSQLIYQRVAGDSSGGIKRSSKTGRPLRSRIASKNTKLVLKYVLKGSVRVPQLEIFQHAVIFTTRERFGVNLAENLSKAIKSAKTK